MQMHLGNPHGARLNRHGRGEANVEVCGLEEFEGREWIERFVPDHSVTDAGEPCGVTVLGAGLGDQERPALVTPLPKRPHDLPVAHLPEPPAPDAPQPDRASRRPEEYHHLPGGQIPFGPAGLTGHRLEGKLVEFRVADGH